TVAVDHLLDLAFGGEGDPAAVAASLVFHGTLPGVVRPAYACRAGNPMAGGRRVTPGLCSGDSTPAADMNPKLRPCLLALALLAPLAACQKTEPTDSAASAASAAAPSQADAAFADLSQRALDGWMKLSPISATQIGEHRYDGELDDLSAEGRRQGVEFTRGLLSELDALDIASLPRENQVDAAILRNQLEYDLWSEETYQSWAWDPQLYSELAGSAIYGLMAREFAPRPERLKSATA